MNSFWVRPSYAEKQAGAIPGHIALISGAAYLTEVRLGIFVKASQRGARPSSVKVPPIKVTPQIALLSRLHNTSPQLFKKASTCDSGPYRTLSGTHAPETGQILAARKRLCQCSRTFRGGGEFVVIIIVPAHVVVVQAAQP